MQHQFDKMVEQLEQDLESGNLTQAEFREELRELERDYRGAAEEAAREAYEAELYRW